MSYWERMSTSTRRPCSPEKAADSWLRWHPLRAQSSTSPSPPTAIRASVDIPALRFNVHLPPLLTLVQGLDRVRDRRILCHKPGKDNLLLPTHSVKFRQLADATRTAVIVGPARIASAAKPAINGRTKSAAGVGVVTPVF